MLTEFFGVSTLEAIFLTLKLAFITSGLLLLIALPLAWFLANWQSKAKPLVMSILALPLVLPPTVLGFYLLIAFSPQSALGQGWQSLTGSNLAFSFEGLVLGSVIYSLPFALQPLYSGFSQLDNRYLDVAKTLGFSAFGSVYKNSASFKQSAHRGGIRLKLCTYHRRVWRSINDRWQYSWRNSGAVYRAI